MKHGDKQHGKDKQPKHITELKPESNEAMDIRGIPTTVCPCGSMVWNLKTVFNQDDGSIELYFIDMECAQCGTLATAPTPVNGTLEE